jgi:Carboxymuconolactone decarboxylase family
MHDDERRASGTAMRRKILGAAHVDRARAAATPLTADLHDFITRYVWSEVWTRPGLDERTRRVLVLGTLIALGRWEEFGMHVRAAVGEGGPSTAACRRRITPCAWRRTRWTRSPRPNDQRAGMCRRTAARDPNTMVIAAAQVEK